MFPGTNFQPNFWYLEIGASTVPESSGGDANYNAQSPAPSGITKFHWRRDYSDGGSWTEIAHPGYENPDSYSSDGYDGWSHNALTNKFAKDFKLGNGYYLSGAGAPNGTYVIKIPEDVAMGSKEVDYNPYTLLHYVSSAVHMGNFPPGSTIIIHNYGIIAGGGGTGGAGGAIYHSGTPSNDATGGGGGGGAGLHDWDLPFEKHEQGDNWGPYPLDSNKNDGEMPNLCFPGSGGTPGLQITVFNGDQAANGGFGPGNLVSTDNSTGGAGSVGPTGITFAGVPVLAGGVLSHTAGNIGGHVFHTAGPGGIFWIHNHSTGKIIAGGGGGGGGYGVGNDGRAGGAGGDPGESGVAGSNGGAAGAAGVVFHHDNFWDPVAAARSKYILKQNDGIIKGQGSNFDVIDSEH